ncbi:hypothetical protein Tco_1309215 [Tanacetum coccineum]
MGDTIAQTSLKRRVEKLEQKKRSRTHVLKILRKVGATARIESSGDEESLEMFDVDALDGEEVFVARQNENVVKEVVDAAQPGESTTTTATILTPRKEIVITELGTPTITRSSQQPSQEKVQDKGKEKMIEPEKPLKKKDLITLDEEIASKTS